MRSFQSDLSCSRRHPTSSPTHHLGLRQAARLPRRGPCVASVGHAAFPCRLFLAPCAARPLLQAHAQERIRLVPGPQDLLLDPEELANVLRVSRQPAAKLRWSRRQRGRRWIFPGLQDEEGILALASAIAAGLRREFAPSGRRASRPSGPISGPRPSRARGWQLGTLVGVRPRELGSAIRASFGEHRTGWRLPTLLMSRPLPAHPESVMA